MTPHIYHTEDWLAPPEYVSARPSTELPWVGGEYASVYWSESPAQLLNAEMRAFGDNFNSEGRHSEPQELPWRGRLDLLAGQARSGLQITLDAIPLADRAGMMLQIDELAVPDDREEYRRRLESVHGEQLGAGLFLACYQFIPIGEQGRGTHVRLFYTDRDDPLGAFAEAQRVEEHMLAKEAANVRRVFASAYLLLTPERYGTYT
jgi:hypothetical protein